jgi:hypothetical protein
MVWFRRPLSQPFVLSFLYLVPVKNTVAGDTPSYGASEALRAKKSRGCDEV